MMATLIRSGCRVACRGGVRASSGIVVGRLMCIPYNKAARRTLPIYVGIVGKAGPDDERAEYAEARWCRCTTVCLRARTGADKYSALVIREAPPPGLSFLISGDGGVI